MFHRFAAATLAAGLLLVPTQAQATTCENRTYAPNLHAAVVGWADRMVGR